MLAAITSVLTSRWFWSFQAAACFTYMILLLNFEGKDAGEHPLQFAFMLIMGIAALPGMIVLMAFVTLCDTFRC